MIKLKNILKLIAGISFLYSSALYSQVDYNSNNFVSPLDLIQKQKSTSTPSLENKVNEPTREDYTQEEIYKLNELLEKQNYISFYDLFQSLNVSGIKQIDFLDKNKYKGHVPLYWLMADYYAKVNNIEQTHKWLYIATIMTQQDAEICTDTTSTGASRKLIKAFPLSTEITRATPEYIYPIMKEVIFFVENIKERSHPIWACNFGEVDPIPGHTILYSENSWDSTRNTVLQRYKDIFNN